MEQRRESGAENITDLLCGDDHLDQEVLDAPASKRRKRCAFGGDCAYQLLPRRAR